MPPFLPRKRLHPESPEAGTSKPTTKAKGKAKAVPASPRKPTLFDDIDAGTGSKRTAEQNRVLLENLANSDDDESSLTSLSEEEFEDVSNAKRQKTDGPSDDQDDEDEDIEFEDVETNAAPGPSGPPPSGDLELTLRKDTRISITNPYGTKKGPSKIERQIRISTHQVHVQMLMYHNAIRNSWLCNKDLQEMLVKQLPASIMERVGKWRRDSGLGVSDKKPSAKGKGKGKPGKVNNADVRSQRDWGEPAQRLAEGEVDMSSGDPLIGLLKRLAPYWKQRFRITAPGLRKLGYMSLPRLDDEMKSFNNDKHDPELHGELIRDIEDFKNCAKAMEGSRDVGAQLFTALLRGLGIEARLVANLQPVGIGWSQNEEATEKNPRKLKKLKEFDEESSDDEEASEDETLAPKTVKTKGKAPAKPKKDQSSVPTTSRRASKRGGLKNALIEFSDSDEAEVLSDEESVIDITPAKQRTLPSKPYDKDLLFPHYWTEVLSPVTNTHTPVDPIVLNIVADNSKSLERFEPRGAKSEKAKQVTTYIVGHSSDGTAKEVTTRYLKNHMWPSRTKGNRLGVEKVPIYNRHGKVKRYEQYDWFKTVMSGYVRGSKDCPRTEIDDHEDATILKPVKPEKKVVEEGKETLQSYKSSSEFILERHLRREEALVPTAKHVRMFTVKGKGETSTEEKVYLRKDVVNCKSMETWHKEGREPISGEEPLKRVPYRAATTNRKRELAEAEHASGQKMLQGLYSWDQTDWIIPPPIQNGVIPKNAFGNIDLYVDSMLPEGAAHIPLRGTVKICKRLGLDYAEAVTGFEFGHRMAVPIITGIVVAEENYDLVMEEWEKDEAERVRKEDEKRRKIAVGMWRKMVMGLRIIKRIREEYGDDAGDEVDAINPWTSKKSGWDIEAQRRMMEQRDEKMAGGFLPEGHDGEEVHNGQSSFFPVARDEEDNYGGGFVVEGHDERVKHSVGQAYATPQSLHSTTKHEAEEYEEVDDVESEVAALAPRKRGRPSGSVNKSAKTTPASSKAKTPTKQAQQKTPASRSTGKCKRQVEDSEAENDDQSSSLSELGSDISDSRVMELSTGATRRATMPAKTSEGPRKTPRRNAARKSETALKSHYFAHSDDEDG